MRFHLPTITGCALTLLCYQHAWSQVRVPASDSTTAAVSWVTQRYAASTRAESHLLNGIEYVNLTPAYVVGYPFFLSDRPQQGTVDYDGNRYTRVPLLYEQVQNQVILFDSVRNVNIQLVGTKITSFTLGSHQFVRLRADSVNALPAGFYEVLVDGPARLLARRTKTAVKIVTGQTITGEYELDYRLLVQRRQGYYQVAKLSQALEVLADKRTELQQFAKDNRLKFKEKTREDSMTKLLQRYAELAR